MQQVAAAGWVLHSIVAAPAQAAKPKLGSSLGGWQHDGVSALPEPASCYKGQRWQELESSTATYTPAPVTAMAARTPATILATMSNSPRLGSTSTLRV